MSRDAPPPHRDVAGLAWALAGAAWAAWWGRLGPGMTADTMDYLGIGRAVFALPPDVFQWPPAFWFLLQCARAVGFPAWGAAMLVLCAARALLASGAFRLGRALAGPVGGHSLAAVTFVWVPLTYAGLYCLSETLFLGAMLWWLASAVGVRATAPALHRRVWHTTLWATLMVSTRFLGAPLAAVEWVVATLALRAGRHRHWLRTAALTGVCIVGPALGWAALGRARSGDPFGERHPTLDSLPVHFQRVGMGWWDPIVRGRYADVFWGDQGGMTAPPMPLQAGLYACALVLTFLVLQPRTGGPPYWRVRVFAASMLGLAMLVWVSARVWIDPIGPRFLLPVVVLALAALWHEPRHTRLSTWAVAAVAWCLGLWCVDGWLAGGLSPRFGTGVLAGLGLGGAGVCLAAAWLDPRPGLPSRLTAAVVVTTGGVLLLAQAHWSAAVLDRVRTGSLPSVQHPGWRNAPGVADLRAHIRSGDTVYSHTGEAVRALLDNRDDVHIEPFCFQLLNPECPETLAEYLRALDARARPGGAEWIVLLDRVALPYLFQGELSAGAAARPRVAALEQGTVSAYRWPPDGETTD